MEFKMCNLCKVEKPLSEFSHHGNGKLNAQCKPCVRQRHYTKQKAILESGINFRELAIDEYMKSDHLFNNNNCICGRVLKESICLKCVSNIKNRLENEFFRKDNIQYTKRCEELKELGLKLCSDCNNIKDIRDFPKDRSRFCNSCRSIRRTSLYTAKNIERYIESAGNIVDFRPTLLYIIEFTDTKTKEVFIKFGVTVQTLESRYCGSKYKRYTNKTLYTYVYNTYKAAELVEAQIREATKPYEMSTLTYSDFQGYTECRKPDALASILTLIENSEIRHI